MMTNQPYQDRWQHKMSGFRQFIRENSWMLICIWALLSFLLGLVGLVQLIPEEGVVYNFWDAVYEALRLFIIDLGHRGEMPLALDIARFLAPASTAAATVLGLIILLKDKIAELSLRRYRGHVVVCGLGRKGQYIISDFLTRGWKIVAIELDPDNKKISELQVRGVFVLKGVNACDPVVLKKGRVFCAKYVLALTDSNETNIEIARQTEQVVKKHIKKETTERVTCIVNLDDYRLKRAIVEHSFFAKTRSYFYVRLFSVYDTTARLIVKNNAPDMYMRASSPDDPAMHILVIGFDKLGQQIVTQSALLGHYSNGKKLIVTVIDHSTDQQIRNFENYFPNIGNIIDLRYHNLECSEIGVKNLKELQQESRFAAIYIARGDDNLALADAFDLQRKLRDLLIHNFDERMDGLEPDEFYKLVASKVPPIIVAMPPVSELGEIVSHENTDNRFLGIHIFNMMDNTCIEAVMINEQLDHLAHTIHEEYVSTELKKGTPLKAWASLVHWDELAEDYKDANRNQSDHFMVKLRALGLDTEPKGGPKTPVDFRRFLEDNPEMVQRLAQAEHRRWNADRWIAGWTYGRVRNDKLRLHSSLIPWDEISEAEKQKDIDTIYKIPAQLALIGEEICFAESETEIATEDNWG